MLTSSITQNVEVNEGVGNLTMCNTSRNHQKILPSYRKIALQPRCQ